ncbi:MAG TPA: hypothetical protein VEF53_03300 [Patescibacteria group bacterium]|nr:hypothetical protein [Patescibacteria group bacterium]
MKKIISIALVFTLILGTTSSAFAKEKVTVSQDDPLLQALITYDIADVSVTLETDTSKTALVTFDNGVVNNVIVNKEQDETIYKISQGSLNDIITVASDGEIFLNNKSIGSTGNPIVNVINQPFQQTQCPYGSASDYSYKAGSEQDSNIALEKAIRNYTVAALAIIVVYNAGPLLIAAIGGGGTAVSTGLFTKMLNDAVSSSPDSKALSYKLTFYYHKNYTNGNIPPILMYVRKNVITYYPEASYKGASSKYTSYSGTIL